MTDLTEADRELLKRGQLCGWESDDFFEAGKAAGVATERERCAKVVESFAHYNHRATGCMWCAAYGKIAAAIRAGAEGPPRSGE